MRPKLYTSKVYMERQFYRNKKTPEALAKELGVSTQTIYTWIKKHGIKA